MHFSVKFTVTGTLDGTTNMPSGPYTPAGTDGTIHIDVNGNLGLIDPDLSDQPAEAAVPLLLQSAHVVLPAKGMHNTDGVYLVDADNNVAVQLIDLTTNAATYTDVRRIIPIGYKILVRAEGQSGSPTPIVVRLSVWQITDVGQLAALP